jgi:hypothetical protein
VAQKKRRLDVPCSHLGWRSDILTEIIATILCSFFGKIMNYTVTQATVVLFFFCVSTNSPHTTISLFNKCHWFTVSRALRPSKTYLKVSYNIQCVFLNLISNFCTLHYMFRPTLIIITCLKVVGKNCYVSVLWF